MRYPHLTQPPLVAIAHGSRDPRAGATITELLGVARERAAVRGLAGLDIRAAFLDHAPPAPLQVLSALGGGAVVVLPVLLTAAYHSGTDIPGLLDDAQAALPALRVRYGAPLGPHPGLLGALDQRLAEAGQDLAEAGQTSVVLAAAGSSHPAANAVIAQLAAQWQASRGWQAVRPAFASAASPTPEQAVAGLIRGGARRVVVASYLLAPGRFADQVAGRSLAAGAAAVSAPLGAAAEVADVLLDRYRQALAELPRELSERQVSVR
jgi:sirohydrochlorin ferrochelatase